MLERGLRCSAAAVVFYALSAVALWSIYSMKTQIDGGVYSVTEAHTVILKMAAITTALCVAAIILGKLIFRNVSLLRTVLQSGLCTGVFLIAYTALNVLWRNSWSPTSGRSAFLPVWSDVNSRFFYEYNWLSYLLFLTPVAMVAAAVLMWLADYRKT
jgi:hypothetical protein